VYEESRIWMYEDPAAPSNGGIALALIGGVTGFAMGTMSPEERARRLQD
jgi:hypothetical protein